MAETLKQKDGLTLVWGNGLYVATGYLTTSSTLNKTSSKVEAADEVGDVAAVSYFNQQLELTITAYLKSGTDTPVPGADMTVNGVKYIVENTGEARTNNNFVVVTINLRRYVANAIPA